MLYRPEAFEPLTEELWDERRVREAIRTLVAYADAAFEREGLWPADEWDAWNTPTPLKALYVGAAGVIWALDTLGRRGHAESRLDLRAAALRTLEAWRAEPDLMREIELPAAPEAGLMAGELGVLAVAWRLAPDDRLADDLLARVRESAASEADDLMWGIPGALVAARELLDRTGDTRWGEAWRELGEELWRRRDADGLWTQRLYGGANRGLGPAHGVVGNTLTLLRGRELLAGERRAALERETAAVLARTAVVEDGLANWPAHEGRGLVGRDGEIRVQWCAGAPGIVTSTAEYLDEELLLAGAELAWKTGPPGMEKGSSVCHGTAGNGYALLKVFERTGDERWLERARRFAVHALGQVERRGHGRYSLWTGDLGVALYVADCLDARAAYPILDTWD